MEDLFKQMKIEFIELFREIDRQPKLHTYLIAESNLHSFKSVFCPCFPTIKYNPETAEWFITHRSMKQAEVFRGKIIQDKGILELLDKYK